MALPEHSKIITRIAKTRFKPFGIKQKGQSRIWLDDRGWYTTVIEFQPFRGNQGTTLNVGVNFHWNKQSYLSFDIGYRQDVDFVKFLENEEKFSEEVEKLCDLALSRIEEYRDKLKDIHTAKPFVLDHTFTSEDIWGSYHKGTICGLTNDFEELNTYYRKLLNATHPGEWLNQLKTDTQELLKKAPDNKQFTEEIIEIINQTRGLKKLPEMKINFSEE